VADHGRLDQFRAYWRLRSDVLSSRPHLVNATWIYLVPCTAGSDQGDQYKTLRSVSDHLFVVCRDSEFYSLPEHVRKRGPWQGSIGAS
jgi:hypothetical protein